MQGSTEDLFARADKAIAQAKALAEEHERLLGVARRWCIQREGALSIRRAEVWRLRQE
jgi:hypothetical protein